MDLAAWFNDSMRASSSERTFWLNSQYPTPSANLIDRLQLFNGIILFNSMLCSGGGWFRIQLWFTAIKHSPASGSPVVKYVCQSCNIEVSSVPSRLLRYCVVCRGALIFIIHSGQQRPLYPEDLWLLSLLVTAWLVWSCAKLSSDTKHPNLFLPPQSDHIPSKSRWNVTNTWCHISPHSPHSTLLPPWPTLWLPSIRTSPLLPLTIPLSSLFHM